MIKAIAQLAKVMCIETVAEYVETDMLRARMADLGVDYGQGFAMGKHQPLEQRLEELAVFEATVNDWEGAATPQPPPDKSPIPVLQP
jgi:EAL domain-containing protein (putative c-di-GMP-specific phosphodiesterase class I)